MDETQQSGDDDGAPAQCDPIRGEVLVPALVQAGDCQVGRARRRRETIATSRGRHVGVSAGSMTRRCRQAAA
jgi:hypothetical protein